MAPPASCPLPSLRAMHAVLSTGMPAAPLPRRPKPPHQDALGVAHTPHHRLHIRGQVVDGVLAGALGGAGRRKQAGRWGATTMHRPPHPGNPAAAPPPRAGRHSNGKPQHTPAWPTPWARRCRQSRACPWQRSRTALQTPAAGRGRGRQRRLAAGRGGRGYTSQTTVQAHRAAHVSSRAAPACRRPPPALHTRIWWRQEAHVSGKPCTSSISGLPLPRPWVATCSLQGRQGQVSNDKEGGRGSSG